MRIFAGLPGDSCFPPHAAWKAWAVPSPPPCPRARTADGCIVALADMPFIQPASILAVRRALEAGASIAVPSVEGQAWASGWIQCPLA